MPHFLLTAAIALLLFIIPGPARAQTSVSQLELNAVLYESSELLKAGDASGALALLKRYEPQFSSEAEYLNNLAIAYLGSNQPENALSILRQLVEADPIFGIVSHNLLEMELQIAGAGAEKINPILFVQTTESFFDQELSNTTERSIPPEATQTQTPEEVAPSTTSGLPSPHPMPDPEASAALVAATEARVRNWANTWERRNFDGYLDFYSEQFEPNGITYDQWLEQRRASLSRPGELSIQVSHLSIDLLDDNHVQADFIQDFSRANSYSDRVEKTLLFTRENGMWKITREIASAPL